MADSPSAAGGRGRGDRPPFRDHNNDRQEEDERLNRPWRRDNPLPPRGNSRDRPHRDDRPPRDSRPPREEHAVGISPFIIFYFPVLLFYSIL